MAASRLFVPEEREPLRFRWGAVLAALATGALLGAGTADLTDDLAERLVGAPEPATVAREWPARPLPPEWSWSPPTVEYKHMYRSARR